MSGNLRSILAMLAAVGFFSLMDAVLKALNASYSRSEEHTSELQSPC